MTAIAEILAGTGQLEPETAVTDILLSLAGDARRWQHSLLTAYRALTRESTPGDRAGDGRLPGLDIVHGAAAADRAVRDLLTVTRQAAAWIHRPGPAGSRTAGLLAGLDRPENSPALRALVDAGPEQTGAVLAHLPVNADVRLTGIPAAAGPGRHDAIVLDGAVLALLSDPDETEPYTVLISQAGAAGLVQSLFDTAWAGSLPAGAGPAGPGPLDGGLKHQILRRLAEGGKDEAIARALGISLRTCRRYIADILADAGAVSRFQAGYRLGRDRSPGTPR